MRNYFIFIFCILFLLPSMVNAHGLYLSTKGRQLKAYFSDGSPASNAAVTIVDDNGLVIMRDKTDEKGNCLLPDRLDYPPHLIIVEAPGGHRTKITWQAAIEGTNHGVFDSLIVRLIVGIFVLAGSGFVIKRLINPKSKT